jgi:hypothetical protein
MKRVGDRRLTVHFTEKPQPGIHEYFLSLDYTGDVAVGFLENRVIADNLWQGTGPWLIGLNRFSEGLQRDDIGFYFRPLRRQAPFLNTIPASNVPAFKPESDDSVLGRDASAFAEYFVTRIPYRMEIVSADPAVLRFQKKYDRVMFMDMEAFIKDYVNINRQNEKRKKRSEDMIRDLYNTNEGK